MESLSQQQAPSLVSVADQTHQKWMRGIGCGTVSPAPWQITYEYCIIVVPNQPKTQQKVGERADGRRSDR